MKTVNVFFSAIACGLLLAGCAKEITKNEGDSAQEGKQVSFTIKAKALETKTYIDYDSGTKTYTPKWKNGNQIGVFFDTWSADDPVSANFANTAADGEDAVFSGTGTVKAEEQTIYAFYPSSSWVKTYADGIGLSIPEVQKPTASSYDESADLIVNKPYPITIDNSSVSIDDMRFARILATLKVVVKDGTAASALASDEISSITLQSTMTGAALTGRIKWNYDTAESTMMVSKTSVTGDLSANPIAINNPIYLLVNPITLTTGTDLNISISTNNHEISKEVTLANDLEFLQGGVAVLNITIRDTDTIGPAILEPTGDGWYLVQKASWLKVGDKVVITNLASDGALGAASGAYRSKVTVSVTDGKLSVGDATQLTLAAGNADGSWAFKDGDNYLYHSGDKSVGTKATLDDSGSWIITVGGTGTKINNVGSSTYYLQYNSSNPRFTDYTGTQQDVRIYKKYSLPQLDPITVTLTPDHANKEILVQWVDVDNATNYEVTCTGQSTQNIAPGVQQATFTGLSYNTEYTIEVTASAAGYVSSSDSDAVTLVNPAAKTITRLKASVTGVAAAGVTNATEGGVYSLTNATDGDVTATPDGTVVTAASVSGGTLTYSVSANTGAARNGSVTLSVAGGNSVTVTISQLAGVQYYTKVTSITPGKKYLMVDGTHIFNGASVETTTPAVDATIVDNSKIEKTNTIDTYAVTISSATGGKYKVKLSTNKYLVINENADTNGNLKSDESGEAITISKSGNYFQFISGNRSSRGIAYRTSASGFKNYAISNFGTSGYGGNFDLYEEP